MLLQPNWLGRQGFKPVTGGFLGMLLQLFLPVLLQGPLGLLQGCMLRSAVTATPAHRRSRAAAASLLVGQWGPAHRRSRAAACTVLGLEEAPWEVGGPVNALAAHGRRFMSGPVGLCPSTSLCPCINAALYDWASTGGK